MSSRVARAPGRNEELAALRRAYRAACDRELRLLLLEGPGKDTLLEAWLSEHRAGPVLRVRCAAHRGEPRALEALVAEALAHLSPVRRARHPARALLKRPGAESKVPDLLVQAERRLRLREEVLRLVAEIGAPNPAVVVLEDADRADRATLETLQALVAQATPFSQPPAVLVVASASAPPRGRLAEVSRGDAAEVLSLQPLDRAGVRELLASPDVVDAVLALTGGLPELVEQLVRGEGLGGASAPEPAARAALEVLAVVDQPLQAEELAQLLDAQLLDAQLDERALERGGAERRGDTWRLRPRTAERVRATLDPSAALPIHRRAAELFAKDRAALATRHALRAGLDGGQATALAARAVEQLLAQHAPEEAAELLLEVVEARPDAPPALRRRLVELLWISGDHAGAIREGRALAEAQPGDEQVAQVLGQLLLHSGRPQDAIEVLTSVTSLAGQAALAEATYRAGAYDEADALAADVAAQADEATLRLDAENTRAKVALARGEREAAERRFTRCLAEAEAIGATRQVCQALNNLGILALGRGELPAAVRRFEGALALAEQSGALYHRGLAHKNLAVATQLQGEWAAALRHGDQALARLSGLVNPNLVARLSFNAADLHRSLGDPYRALRLCAHARDAAGELEPAVDGEGLRVEAAIHLELGRLGEARGAYDAALSIARALGDADAEAESELGLARVALARGEAIEAEALLAAVGPTRQPRNEARRTQLDALLGLAHPARAPEEAIPLGRIAVDAATQTNDPLLIQEARLVMAQALFAGGLPGRAREELRGLRAVEGRLRLRVPETLRHLFDERALMRRLAGLERSVGGLDAATARPTLDAGGGLVGDGPGMRELRSWIARVGPTESTVLIQGESGTGKELVAEALHAASRRADKPFVRVNCAALVDTLLASELFGHERGAFTGADRQKKGRFELAEGGTLLLDEVGDISPKMQASLLRVLQSRTFERVGGTRTLEVDVRILAATHRDLERLVAEGSFREDLYYRLRGISIQVPALRERVADLGALSRHLLARIAADEGAAPKSLAPDALARLQRHDWPGNVRELENVLRSAAVLNPGQLLTADDFQSIGGASPSSPPPAGASLGALAYERVRDGDGTIYELRKRLERECIERALDDADGNISRAADLLGMKRPRLSKLVNEWGLKK